MGVDAKLFVKIEESRKLPAIQAATRAINELYHAEFDKAFRDSPYENKMKFIFDSKDEQGTCLWSRPRLDSYDAVNFSLSFRINGEGRNLSIMTDIQTEHQRIIGFNPALWFSLGHWGLSDKLMKALVPSLKQFGEVYYDFNDCDDEDFVRL